MPCYGCQNLPKPLEDCGECRLVRRYTLAYSQVLFEGKSSVVTQTIEKILNYNPPIPLSHARGNVVIDNPEIRDEEIEITEEPDGVLVLRVTSRNPLEVLYTVKAEKNPNEA